MRTITHRELMADVVQIRQVGVPCGLSVSDIIALKRDGVVTCHYCDSVGFERLTDFFTPKPTVAELEAQVKAGQTISLLEGDPMRSQDLRGKGGARERTQFSLKAETELSGLCDDAADAVHREKGQKRSVVAQLKGQPSGERKKSAPKKSAGKER